MFGNDDLTVQRLDPTFHCAMQYAVARNNSGAHEVPVKGKEMRNLDHSPSAAEVYFDRSVFGQLYMLIADALQRHAPDERAGPGRQGTKATNRRRHDAGKSAGTPKPPRTSLLDRLEAWQWRQSQKDREAYLSRAKDVFDLERRIDALERGFPVRYY
jgi:hypothetical protein